jgi:hypothetical protein
MLLRILQLNFNKDIKITFQVEFLMWSFINCSETVKMLQLEKERVFFYCT